jgi:predicted nucleic acid-binding protein
LGGKEKDKMTKYLIDASAMLGLANDNDVHHAVCKKFFDEQPSNLFYFALHSLFEIQAARARRIRNGDYVGLPGNYNYPNVNFINIDWNFFKECKQRKLFDVFDRLKGMDLIYACLAKIGKYTLVTCDYHFDSYNSKIDILNLAV